MLQIKVIGLEDQKQKDLVNKLTEVAENLKIPLKTEYINTWEDIMQYDIIATPALIADGKFLLFQGFVPDTLDLASLLKILNNKDKGPSSK